MLFARSVVVVFSIPLLSQSCSISTRGVYLSEVVSLLPQAFWNGWKASQEP